MKLPAGFRIELVAAEPDVVDPVAMTFDESGRMYAVEMRDYPMGDNPAGRVRLLEDKDGDGRFESSIVFADNLVLPNGVMRWRKGILVTSTPDILYLEDTDGDGKADVRNVMLTGFASQNPQLRLNGPQYGYDNWIYAAYTRRHVSRRYAKEFGDIGGTIRFPGKPDAKPLDTHSHDIRFRPDEGRIDALAGFSQFGWGFNEVGDRFVVWNSDHVRHIPIDAATAERNPYQNIATPWESVSDHKAQSTVYPITENPQHIHDSQIGQFTSSCGLSIYTGANLPADFQNCSFTCEPVHNLVHRDILKPKGGTYVASRAYEKSEFLASTDSWFRPVFTMTGPDGALYVVDMYRPSVEHPEFVPPELLKDLDFTTKPNRGRIWRVVHESSSKRARPALDRAADSDLVSALADANLWWRIQAQRLLVDRKATGAAGALERMAAGGPTPYARMHALWTLDGLGLLKSDHILASMNDADPVVRRHGVRLARTRPDDRHLRAKVITLAGDGNPQVRYETALTIAGFPEAEGFQILKRIVLQDPGQTWLQTVALSNARERPFAWFEVAISQPTPDVEFVLRAAALTADRGNDADIARMLAAIRGGQAWNAKALEGIAQGIASSKARTAPHPLSSRAIERVLALAQGPEGESALRIASAIGARPRDLIASSAKLADDSQAPAPERARAAGIAGLGGAAAVAKYLAPSYPAEVRLAAVKSAARSPDSAEVTRIFLDNWRAFSGPMREAGLPALLRSPKSILALFDAMEANRVPMWAIDAGRARALQGHQDPAVKERARKLFESAGADRKKVLNQYLAAVHKNGNAEKGKSVFVRVCSECHELDGKGYAVGPDLRGVTKRYKEVLLANILLPSENIEPGYEEYVVETKDGRTLTGILARDTPSSILLRRSKNEEDTVPRSEIKELRAAGTSSMPDGMEKDITIDEMADLIAYIKLPK
jgi:putative membrane-bound dehydrogenase-like protein